MLMQYSACMQAFRSMGSSLSGGQCNPLFENGAPRLVCPFVGPLAGENSAHGMPLQATHAPASSASSGAMSGGESTATNIGSILSAEATTIGLAHSTSVFICCCGQLPTGCLLCKITSLSRVDQWPLTMAMKEYHNYITEDCAVLLNSQLHKDANFSGLCIMSPCKRIRG